MVDFLHFLKNTSYPGRGILVGKDRVYYFIMGRSENSRNRVFVKTDDGIRTEAFDPAKPRPTRASSSIHPSARWAVISL